MTRSNVQLFIIVLILTLLSLSCKDIGGITPDKKIVLSAEDASCTEVWLKIKIGSGNTNREVTLKRDAIILFTKTMDDAETIFIDSNLAPNHTYTYTAQLTKGSISSIPVTTMDTTNHSFSWQTFTLGDGTGNSTLYDVAIINDTLAYACGAVYSGGNICNLAKWDGIQWDTLRISVTLTYTSSQMVTDQDPLKTIYAFNENDIWVVSQAGGVSHWNGAQWVMLSIPFNQGPGACNKMWGTSSSDLYFVGSNGRIIYYNGNSWMKIESSTSLNVQDIYGAIDIKTGERQILAIACDEGLGKKLLRIQGLTASSVLDSGLSNFVFNIWFMPNRKYYAVGAGIFYKHSLGDPEWNRYPPGIVTSNESVGVRGNDFNDVFVTGSFLEIVHFNGYTWHNYRNEIPSTNAAVGVAIRNNLVVMAGLEGSRALVIVGRR